MAESLLTASPHGTAAGAVVSSEAVFHATLAAAEVGGGRNETGGRRHHAFRRSDVHRPAALVTEDYEFLGAYDRGGPGGLSPEAARWMHDLIIRVVVQPGRRFASITPGGCDHCGARNLRYVALLLHKPSGAVIHVGERCLGNRFDRATGEFHRLRRQAELDRQQQRIKHLRKQFLASSPDLAILVGDDDDGLPEDAHYILHDLARKLRNHGSLSEAQVTLAKKLLAEDARWRAERAAEPPVVPIPDRMLGQVTLDAVILGTKWQEGRFGARFKALLQVQADGGVFRVWSTVPKAEPDPRTADGEYEPDGWKGRRVRWTGILTRKDADPIRGIDADPTFGFLSHPRIAKEES